MLQFGLVIINTRIFLLQKIPQNLFITFQLFYLSAVYFFNIFFVTISHQN